MRNGEYKDIDGNIGWYQDGKLHREDGPAFFLANGGQAWFQHGLEHREDGPAVEYADGTNEWWIYGVQHTQEQFQQWRTKKQLNDKLSSTLEPRHTEKKKKI